MEIYIPDPVERLEMRIENYMDNFIDEYTCMECGKKVEYELICPSPIGDGPALCIECSGIDPDKILTRKKTGTMSGEGE